MSLYDNEEAIVVTEPKELEVAAQEDTLIKGNEGVSGPIVNNEGGTSETPSNLVNDNLDNLVSEEELRKILQYKKDGNVNESKLSPNPAGFGFTKQEFVDYLPLVANAQPNTLYILKVKNDGVVVGYKIYKFVPFGNGQDAHFSQFGATPDLTLVDGKREQKAIENTQPKAAPAKVFNGDVVFNGKVTNKDGEIVSVEANPISGGQGEVLDKIKIGSKVYNVLVLEEVIDIIVSVVNNIFVGTTLYSKLATFGPGNVANLVGSFNNSTIEL